MNRHYLNEFSHLSELTQKLTVYIDVSRLLPALSVSSVYFRIPLSGATRQLPQVERVFLYLKLSVQSHDFH